MARSRQPAKVKQVRPGTPRWQWRRVAAGIAEFFRNFSLVAFTAPFVEPWLTGGIMNSTRALIGVSTGFVFLVDAIILDHERRD